MKQFLRILSLLTLLCVALTAFAGCGADNAIGDVATDGASFTETDWASQIKLNMASDTVKQEVTVKTFIDGDTTHFNVPSSVIDTGVLKARYLAINTPESTGKIEEYGKAAANFTKEKLSNATSIIIESDDSNWNVDSTGGRYLVWVWYKTADMEEYRNLNIEILQNGLAIANSSAQNRYGSTCMSAINQAKELKLGVYSGKPDPDFYYGEAVELTLKELRCNISDYNGIKVAFNGVITVNDGSSVYVESYDPETNMYYGMSVYYGYGLSGEGLDILSIGNEARIVGTVQYYEAGGTYQVSGLTYRMMKPDDPGNIQKISEGNAPAYLLTDAETFANGKVSIETDEELLEFDYAALAMGSSIEMRDLKVISVYTTLNEDSSSYGAITLNCEVDGVLVDVRTAVLHDESGNLITEDMFIGKTVDVKGIVDFYDGNYQIKVFTANNITIK